MIIAVPWSGSNNNTTISSSTKEASTTNPVVAYLLLTRVIHSRKFFLNLLVFYYPGQENFIKEDTSRLFILPSTPFLAGMSSTCPQLQTLLLIYFLPPQLISCMIFTARRRPWEQKILNMRNTRGCKGIGNTSAPPFWPTLLYKIHPYSELASYGFTYTASKMLTTPSDAWTNLGKVGFSGMGVDCSDPPPRWPPRPKKPPRRPRPHQNG